MMCQKGIGQCYFGFSGQGNVFEKVTRKIFKFRAKKYECRNICNITKDKTAGRKYNKAL